MGHKGHQRVPKGGQAIQKGVTDLFWSWIGLAKATTRAPGVPKMSQKGPRRDPGVGGFWNPLLLGPGRSSQGRFMSHKKKRLLIFGTKNKVPGDTFIERGWLQDVLRCRVV